jgi:hypothetical protein
MTQLYGSGISELNPNTKKGSPFPEAFEKAVSALVSASFGPTPAPLALQGGIESTNPAVTPFTVCAPEGASKVTSTFGFVRRKGVTVKVKHSGNCAKVTVKFGKKYTVMEPRARQCDMRWPWLSTKLAEALEVVGHKSNEIETIRVNATGGTFTITYGGETTAPIEYNASAGEVQTALEALPSLTGNVSVTGGPGGTGGGTPYTLLFGGTLAETSITPVTTDRSALTGGAKLASVVVTRPGGELDLRRFILSLIEQKAKVKLEELGGFTAIERIEKNMALTPQTPCLDPLSGPTATHGSQVNNSQPFPYYGQLQIGSK